MATRREGAAPGRGAVGSGAVILTGLNPAMNITIESAADSNLPLPNRGITLFIVYTPETGVKEAPQPQLLSRPSRIPSPARPRNTAAPLPRRCPPGAAAVHAHRQRARGARSSCHHAGREFAPSCCIMLEATTLDSKRNSALSPSVISCRCSIFCCRSQRNCSRSAEVICRSRWDSSRCFWRRDFFLWNSLGGSSISSRRSSSLCMKSTHSCTASRSEPYSLKTRERHETPKRPSTPRRSKISR
mmetsp:Transcript_7902/g.18929  ORF Transcript_7902/g.18929 Transcript_7902/m.18929 type:complete len:244 (-) Transcript_7902:261-992(-)